MLFLLALEELEEAERELIGRLYSDYSKRVKEMSVTIMHSDRYADDIVNDTFLKVIRYKENILNMSEAGQIGFILMCTRSICYNLHKRNKKIRFESTDTFYRDDSGKDVELELVADTDVLKTLIDAETGIFLQDAIDGLKSPAKEMVILKFYHEMKNAEIAEFYEMNPSTVSTIIQRSMKHLRKDLERYVYGTDK